MIEVRLVRRTHYQVLEPALLRSLIVRCTSPVNSDFPDRVAKRLSDSTEDLNVAAAGYAVDLAKALKLLNGNLVWGNLGHLLNVVGTSTTSGIGFELNDAERIVFFRLFLEFDGAALIFFSKKIEAQGTLPSSCERWTDIAQELFETTYSEYLQFVTEPQLRVRVRQWAEKRRRQPFRGKSGAHQSWVHVHALRRLLIVEELHQGGARAYKASKATCGGRRPTARLLDMVPDLTALERVIGNQTYYEVAREVLGYSDSRKKLSDAEFLENVLSVYDRVMATGVALCPIQTLAEAIQVQAMIENRSVPQTEDIVPQLRRLQQNTPHGIRLHVDRLGYPAYIKMDRRCR